MKGTSALENRLFIREQSYCLVEVGVGSRAAGRTWSALAPSGMRQGVESGRGGCVCWS